MNDETNFPKLTDSDPVIERMVRRSKKSQILFRRLLWFAGALGGAGVCWCIYLGVSGQYERLKMVLTGLGVIAALILKGFLYLRRLEELQDY